MLPGLHELHNSYVKWKDELKIDPQNPVKSWLKLKQLWILQPEVYSPSYTFNFWHINSRAQEHEPEILALLWQFVLFSPVAQVLLVLIQTGERSSVSPVHLKRQTSKILNSYRCWKKSNCSFSSSGFFFFQSLACRTKLMRISDDDLKKKGKENLSDRSTAKA